MNLTETDYVSSKAAEQILGVHANTLRRWANEGKIEIIRPTIRSKRLYNINKVLQENSNNNIVVNQETKICYCRVSSRNQQDDLKRQVEYMEELYPGASIVSDIGSGINFKRKGLQQIITKAKQGEFNELIIAYRDRLCRFAFELIEFILNLFGVKITVINQAEDKSGDQELAEDLLAIIHVFSCKKMGKRRYSKKSNKTGDKPND